LGLLTTDDLGVGCGWWGEVGNVSSAGGKGRSELRGGVAHAMTCLKLVYANVVE